MDGTIYGLALAIGTIVLVVAVGWYAAKHAGKKAREQAEAFGETKRRIMAQAGLNSADLVEAEPDPFTAMLDEVHEPEQERALVLAHLAPTFAEFLQTHTVKEFGMDEARIKGILKGVEIDILLQGRGYLAQCTLACGYGGFEVDLEHADPKHDYLDEDEVRAQLGHEVFISEDSEEELAQRREAWEMLSSPMRERVLEALRAAEMRRLRFGRDEISFGDLQLTDWSIGRARQRDPREKLRNVFVAAQAAVDAVRSLQEGKVDAEQA